MQIAIGADHAGVEMKTAIIAFLKDMGHATHDCGAYNTAAVDYPDIAEQVASLVLNGSDLGILICGTGTGIAIAANKIPGVRAAVCREELSARMARMHNDANILALGARITGVGLAQEIVQAFLNTDFEGGRHQRRVDKISDLESKYGRRCSDG